MPLQWKLINFSFAGGLDQLIDSVLLSAPSAAEIVNLKPDGLGRLDHRYGFTKISSTLETPATGDPASFATGNIKSIFSSGPSLGAVTEQYLYTYTDETSGWAPRGNPPPGTLDSYTVEGRIGNTGLCQMAVTGDYIVMAWQEGQLDSLGAKTDPEVWVKVIHKNGDVHIPAHSVGSKTMSPCVIPLDGDGSSTLDDHILVTWMAYSDALEGYVQGSIKGKHIGPGDISFSSVLTFDTDVRIDATYPYRRHYDVCNTDNSSAPTACFVYIQFTTNQIRTRLWSVITPSILQTAANITLRADYSCVAITKYANLRVAIAMGSRLGGAALDYVDVVQYDDETLLALYTNNGVLTDADNNGEVYSIGIGHIDVRNFDGLLVMGSFRKAETVPVAIAGVVTHYRTISDVGVAGTERKVFNGQLCVQPFSHNNRAYAGFYNDQDTLGFGGPFLMDLGIVNGTTFLGEFAVAAWSNGAGILRDITKDPINNFNIGTACTPFIDTDNKVYFSVSVLAEASNTGGVSGRIKAQRLVLDMDAKVKPVKVVDGGCVIPGSITAWFDGVRVSELGWCAPPMAAGVSAQVGVNNGDLVYQGLWYAVDALGLAHRSPPSNDYTLSDSVPGGLVNQDPIFWYRTNPATMRNMDSVGDYPTYVHIKTYFNDSADSTPRQLTPPGMVLGNRYRTNVLNDAEIYNEAIPAAGSRGPALYTYGFADFEAINPGSSKCCAPVRDRIILGGFAEADRIKYSDSISPVAEGSERYAPEFFDLFAFETNSSSRVVGISNSADKVVIFTEASVFALIGDGPDKAGRDDNYSGLVEVSSDYGCISQSTIVDCPVGTFFVSKQGLCLLDNNMQATYIGKVKDEFANNSCVAATHFPTENMVIFAMDAKSPMRLVCYSYDVDMWYTWTAELDGTPVDACVHNDEYYFATNVAVYKYDSSVYRDQANSVDVSASIKTPWLKADGMAGHMRVRKADGMAGHMRVRNVFPFVHSNGDAFDLTINIYKDFDESASPAPFSTTVTAAEAALYENTNLVDSKYHLGERFKAVQIELADDTSGGTTGQGMSVAAVDMEVGQKRGSFKPNPNNRE